MKCLITGQICLPNNKCLNCHQLDNCSKLMTSDDIFLLRSLASKQRFDIESKKRYSIKYTDHYPGTGEIDFVCPCCTKKKPISAAVIRKASYETNTVGVRTIYTRTEKFGHRLCRDCYNLIGEIEDKTPKIFWICYAICIAISIIFCFIPNTDRIFGNQFMPIMVGVIAGFFIASIVKISYKFFARAYYRHSKGIELDLPFEVAEKYNAILR